MQDDKNKDNNNKEGKEEVVEIIEEKVVEEVFEDGKSIDEVIEEDKLKRTNKNYLAVIILLLGALLGSLFVDVAQFVSKKGYSPRALKEAKIFSLDGKTWVAYEEPIVKLNILTVSEDELKDCPTCKPPKEVTDLFKKVMPTLVVEEVDINSEKGKALVKKYNTKSVPALVFSGDLDQTEFYNGEAKVLFNEADDGYILNLTGLGLPIGKYIETPSIDDNNPIIGKKDAPVKIVLFSDHQCPFCAKFFKEIVDVSKSFGDKVVLVYKDLPLDFHPQAKNAAIAGECAKDQDKFWEMSERLYVTQNQWGKLKDDQAKDFFKKQAVVVKLDPEVFGKCIDENKHLDEIEKSIEEGKSFGISGTPSVFINDEFVGGVIPADQLRKKIQKQIDKAEGKDVNEDDAQNNADNNDNDKKEE
jgi:protein-disulfide isomerase